VIGIPATNNLVAVTTLIEILDAFIGGHGIPTQSCVLTHITTMLAAIERDAPVDLVFQSIAGTQAANAGFAVDLALLAEGRDAALSLRRGTVGQQVMYFETGWGVRCRPTRTRGSTSRARRSTAAVTCSDPTLGGGWHRWWQC
jgi:ethanolamine ammonia-lyase large subunit